MIHSQKKLSNRELNFKLHRLNWLDNEITRYRDYEWKATSFHSAFFIAIFYFLLDEGKRKILISNKIPLISAIILYLTISIWQLIYIHLRLNSRRNDRSELLFSIGAISVKEKITKWGGFCEGIGVIFILAFIFFFISIAIINILLLI
jgi:hypothetical protein